MAKLGELIKARREKLGLSLRDFAEICKMSHSYIRNLEDGDPRTGKHIVPTLDYLEKLAPALAMSLEDLLQEIGYIHNATEKVIVRSTENYIYEQTREEKTPQLCDGIKDFITDPESKEYILLAKELKDKNISVRFIRDTFFHK